MRKLLSERMNPTPLPNLLISDTVSEKLRHQVIYVIKECVSLVPSYGYSDSGLCLKATEIYDFIAGNPDRHARNGTMECMLKTLEPIDFLNYLDVICHTLLSDYQFNYHVGKEFTNWLNDVLITNSMGYRVVEKQMIPITDIGEAEEIIIPTYSTLSTIGLDSGLSNLKNAYSHYKDRKNREAILSAYMALESTIEFLLEKKINKLSEK